jgi:cyanophycin synthetase
MIIKQVRNLMGPNIWTNRTVLEAWVDLGRYEDFPSNLLPGFNERLERWLPGLIEHRCSEGERGGFLKRLAGGTWLGHVLEHVTLELQSQTHLPVGFGRARETSERGVYKVAIECKDPAFGRRALDVGLRLVMAAAEERDFDIATELSELTKAAGQLCLSPSAQAIVAAAEARGIPAIRLWTGDLVQLGYGCAQQRIGAAETQHTSAVGHAIAQDWALTRGLLSTVGIPVIEGRKVKSADDAWVAASELEGFVVVRARSGSYGSDSSEPLSSRAGVEAAYLRLAAEGHSVVVERYLTGQRYRVLVVGERAVAVSSPAPVSGTAASGRAARSIHDAAFLDVTDRLHPDVAATCVLAAQTVGLDIAGVDLVTADLGQTLQASGGAILEVVARPSLREYLKPLSSRPRPVGEAVVDHLFGVEQGAECQVAAISGTAGKTYVAGLLAAMAKAAGRRVGVADSFGLRVGGRSLSEADSTHFDAARRILCNPFVDTAVLEVDESNVLEAGLAFSRCDVAIVTNLGAGDHLGRKYVEQLGTIRKAVRAAADVVAANGFAVLNADDPEVITMDERCRGKVVYFSCAGFGDRVKELTQKGGRAVIATGDEVVLVEGLRRELLFTLSNLSCPAFGLPQMFLENLLAATAGAIALGLPKHAIVQGVEQSLDRGGIALFESNGARVVVTPARSVAALGQWGAALADKTDSRRLHALFEPPTDWRDEDVISAARVLFSQFFSVALVRSSASKALVSALETGECKPPSDLSAFETLEAALEDRVSRLGPQDLLFVPPVSSDQYQRSVSHLVRKGFSRGKIGGLASVESCR